MELTDSKIWKIIALLSCAFCLAVAILNIFIVRDSYLPGEFVTKDLLLILDFLTAAILFILIFRPDWKYLFTAIFLFHGFVNIADGGDIAGCMLYVIGWSIAFKEGFFRTRSRLKGILIAALLVVPFALQFRFGASKALHSLANILFMCTAFVVLFIIFRHYLVPLLPLKRRHKKIYLVEFGLMPRDFDFIARVRNNEKYSSIAIDYGISESAIKQRMVTIYRKLGVADRSDFLVFANSVALAWPASPQKTAPASTTLGVN